MAWIKRSAPLTPKAEEAPKTDEVTASEEATERPSRRFSKRGVRRGRYAANAAIGLFVLVFAVIGVISTVVGGFRMVQKMRDTSHLTDEMYYTLLPLTQYTPAAFESVEKADQAPLIQAALYAVTNREWIRQQQDVNYVSPYTTDDFGRTIVPIEAVTEAYHTLFGDDFTPTYATFGVEGDSYFSFEYEEEKQHYHVPQQSSGAFEPVIGTIQRAGDTYTVQVGYVHLQDVTVDDHGNKVVDMEKATYRQYYTVEDTEDGYVIRAVTDEATDNKK